MLAPEAVFAVFIVTVMGGTVVALGLDLSIGCITVVVEIALTLLRRRRRDLSAVVSAAHFSHTA